MAYRETTITQKGQVTIPREIRERLRLEPGDRVIFQVEGDAVRIRRAPSKALALYGAFRRASAPRTSPSSGRRSSAAWRTSTRSTVGTPASTVWRASSDSSRPTSPSSRLHSEGDEDGRPRAPLSRPFVSATSRLTDAR
ncbi:MAG TPA: AbrB/MazE/SpoVT family DNA-binding domain-containing protein [Candidatus Tectomicrobia bacterium]|nr:AbrB/MazE/SpoVT family DNA-binding domain-containing protein [Candidatus Tectomicrobia bacterium]